MGYSCTAKAGDTLDALMTLLQGKDEPSSNTWTANGKTYFYEVDRIEQEDGGITGEVILTKGDTGRKIGSFRINGDGRVGIFAGATQKQIMEAEANVKAPSFRRSRKPRI